MSHPESSFAIFLDDLTLSMKILKNHLKVKLKYELLKVDNKLHT